MTDRASTIRPQKGELGFTLMQIMITMTVIAIVSAFALIRIGNARDTARLQNSVSILAGTLEKARIDAIRRHDTSTVVFTSPTTYAVTMDFSGNGTTSTRTFSLENGVKVLDVNLPSVTYNWRGRTSSCTITFAFQNSPGEQYWVDVSDAGDTTINADVDVLPTVSYTTVSGTGDVASSAVVSGTAAHNNTADCTTSTGVVAPPITGTGASNCTISANPSALSIKKNGNSTGAIDVSLANSGGGSKTITSATVSNLRVTPATQTVSGNGTVSFSVTSLNSTRGTFGVTFSSPCTSVTVATKVTN
jgi:Tfp pilus assembly protein FimT